MSVDHQRLNLTNRKGHIRLLPEHLGDVDSGKRSVVSKIQSFFITSLTVEQSGELMAVAETELNLKPCPVNVIDIFAADRGIGRNTVGVHLRADNGLPAVLSASETCTMPQVQKPRLPRDAMSSTVILHLSGFAKSILPSLVLGRPLLPVRGGYVDVIQHGIGTQTAYQRKTDFFQPLDKRQYGEGGIGNEQ